MNETAIVVDDDEFANESLSALLEVSNLKVVGNGFDGKEALDLFSTHKPEYSLIDLSMPNYDGFFAIENIRKINKTSKIFVITGDTSPETKEKVKKLGVNGIIYKPFEIKILLETMRSDKNSKF